MTPGHEAILASAGAGKTYRLAGRILRLLATGAKPEEIVALTFTRKAAAEFVSRVLMALAEAAGSDRAAFQLSERLDLDPEFADRDYFTGLLRDTVSRSHRLRFGTMDGFFQSLVRTHPLELGLTGGFSLLDERRAGRERARILRTLLRSHSGEQDTREFLEAFRLASYGKEARGAASLIEQFAGETLGLYRDSGDETRWGNAEGVWPQGLAWRPIHDEKTLQALADELTPALDHDFGHGTLNRSMRTFLTELCARPPGAPFEPSAFAVKNLLAPKALVPLLNGDPVEFLYQKKVRVIPASFTKPIGMLIRAAIGDELEGRLRRAAGTGRLIARYDRLYTEAVVAQGRLGFADIVHTLARKEHAATLAQAAFRLDGTVKHWLFDEFQDTSRRAWSILAACAGETLEAEDSERTAFFVGDVKQAIYAWNGGDHQLLPEIIDAHRLPTVDLTETQRCGPEVIALVNAVCGALADTPGLTESAATEWRRAWSPHTCAPRAQKRLGNARWILVEKPGRDAETQAAEARLTVVVERIQEAGFLAKGISVGLLTRTNSEASLAAEFLRSQGIDCVCETDVAPAVDNPVTLTLLSAIRHAAHPGDTIAREIAAMSPLVAPNTRILAPGDILRDFTEVGAEGALRRMIARAGALIPDDAFTRHRIDTLLGIAREYDAEPERDAGTFVEFAEATLRRDTSVRGVVQIMTVHKSKGLEFDVVLLPFMEGAPVDSVDSGVFHAFRDAPDAPVRAVMSLPTAAISELDPTLRAVLDERRTTAAYEQFCALYVTLTRAKHEVLIVSHAPSKKTEEDRAPGWTGLLAHAFDLDASAEPGTVLDLGESDWHRHHTAPPAPTTAAAIGIDAVYTPRTISRITTPSANKADFSPDETTRPHEAMGEPTLAAGPEFGTEVHRLFEALHAIGPDESVAQCMARIEATCRASAPDAARFEAALHQVQTALGKEAFKTALTRDADGEVRCEMAFAYAMDEATILAGTFDRVTLYPDSARIQDFKSDRCSGAELKARYAEPMRLYREALAQLTGIEVGKVRLELLHTPEGTVVPLD